MPSSLSIKNVPDSTVAALRRRAERNHRSMQGELMAILEEALDDETPAPRPPLPMGVTTAADALALLKEEGARTRAITQAEPIPPDHDEEQP